MFFVSYPKIGQYNTTIQNIITGERFVGFDSDGKAIYDGHKKLGTVKFTGTTKLHGCFEEDTEITLSNGERIPICEMKQGMSVLTYNFKTKEYINSTVLKVYNFKSEKKWIRIDFDNGTHIKCTEDHKFYTINKGWVCAKDLTSEDEFITEQ